MRGASSRFMPWPSELAAGAMLVVLPDASAAVRLVMLPPDWPELVPMAPTRLAPFWPNRLCQWMPNCASLLAEISTIRLSTSTCARRPSSWSMTARNWRYWGSGAVMISELVAGSAWIWPPVAGWLLLAAFRLWPGLLPPVDVDSSPPPLPVVLPDGPGPDDAMPLPLPLIAARKVAASLVASAFFR